MNKRNNKHISGRRWLSSLLWSSLIVLSVLPFVIDSVSADSNLPLVIRTAVLASPTGSINPHGAAAWQLGLSGELELELEIEDVALPQGTSLTGTVNGNVVGQLTIDDRGRGRIKLRSEDGDTVPAVSDGMVADIRNGSTVLVSGVFGGGPTPSPSASSSPSPSPSPSISPTVSPSPSVSPTGSPSPSPTGTPDGTVVLVRTALLRSPTGSVNPHGNSEWQLYSNGHRELEVEIEDTGLAFGTVLSALVDGTPAGNFTVDIDGKGRLKLKTQLGQTVPTVNDGSTVQVLRGSTVLAAGIYAGGPSPSPTASPTASPSPTGSPNPSPSPSPSPSSSDIYAVLTGPTLNGAVPNGYANYETHSSRTELEVRVKRVFPGSGNQLTVFVDGISVGTFTVQSGEGRLRLRSDDGDIVPQIVSGDPIELRNGGQVVLSGTFSGSTSATPTPTPSVSPSPSPTGTPGATPSPTPGAGRSFEAQLVGSQMQPPVTTTGNGEIKISLNASENTATVFGEFHNLSSDQTSARIESDLAGTTLIFDLGVLGGRNGNFASRTFAVTPAYVQQLRTGLWSAVIGTATNPAGEIRGRFTTRSQASDFNGDGVNEMSFFRPLATEWHVNTELGSSVITFGSPSDKPVSGDYDGDGITDVAVVSSILRGRAVWRVMRSSDGGITQARFGWSTDVPVVGDFDGDGRSDMAFFRPTARTWQVLKSDGSGLAIHRIGIPGDKPIAADIDGDGKDDPVSFSPVEGTWSWIRSTDNGRGSSVWGTIGDIPVRGDFDGDGKYDLTLYRPFDGTWISKLSSTGEFRTTTFGTSADIPVPAKFDGDSKTDIAFFRPSTGTWHVLKSSTGLVETLEFGAIGDIPLQFGN